jgi:hypothetical protein
MNYIEAFIRKAAAARGINPDVAVAVARSEGGLEDPFKQSDIEVDRHGGHERSYGAFQLNLDGGLGEEALKFGIDPRKDWQRGIEYALDTAARKRSWADFHGAANTGIANDAGFGGATKPLGVTLHTTSNPDAALASAAGYTQDGSGTSGPGAGLSAPGVPAAPAAPGTTAAAPGNSKLAEILQGLGTFAASLGARSKSDPSANQLTPSSVDANIPSASAAAQMMAALMAERRKRYMGGTTLTSGGPGGV